MFVTTRVTSLNRGDFLPSKAFYVCSGSIPDLCLWGWQWTKCLWNKFFLEYVDFFVPPAFCQCYIFILLMPMLTVFEPPCTLEKKRGIHSCTDLDRPLGLHLVQASRIFRQMVHEGGRLVSPCISCLYTPGKFSGTHFCYMLSWPQGHSLATRIKSMKNLRHHWESNPLPSGFLFNALSNCTTAYLLLVNRLIEKNSPTHMNYNFF